MTLLISTTAAVVASIVWYFNSNRKAYKLGFLSLMFWGASLMWLVDAIFEYAELGAEFFNPAIADMLNDSYLGLSVVVLGLIIWMVALLLSDPKGVVKGIVFESKSN